MVICQREILTGIGKISVRLPRLQDRGSAEEKVNVHSGLIPPYMRRSATIDEVLPLLYLKGISEADFSRTKSMLHEIWMSETRKEAHEAFDRFIEEYGAKYPKAAACLEKDKIELLAFYDFPAEHWVHLRTTNPIESTCARVKNRTYKAKGAFSNQTIFWIMCCEALNSFRTVG